MTLHTLERRGTGRTARSLAELVARAAAGEHFVFLHPNRLYALELAGDLAMRACYGAEILPATSTLVVRLGDGGGTIRFADAGERDEVTRDWRGRGRVVVLDHAA